MLPPIVTYSLSQLTENQNSKCVKALGAFCLPPRTARKTVDEKLRRETWAAESLERYDLCRESCFC